jgi:hypothetical protein
MDFNHHISSLGYTIKSVNADFNGKQRFTLI